VVVDGDREQAAAQPGQETGEPKQLVEPAFEGGDLLGEIGAESVPEGLILSVGVKTLGGMVERLSPRGRPDQDVPEHHGAAPRSIAELKDAEAVRDGFGKNRLGGSGSLVREVSFHRTQAPSLGAIARHNPSTERSLRPLAQLERTGIVLENIAYDFDSQGFETEKLSAQLVTGWKESPGHRRNMLDPDVTETGVAVARSEKTGYYYTVQMFGRPKSAAIEFQIDNRSGEAVGYAIGDKTFSLPPRYVRTHTRCRPTELTFRWPGEKAKPTSVKPVAGDHLVVTWKGGEYRVTKE